MNNDPFKSNDAADDYRQKYAGVRAVVLGSTGFIGRWVARELCEAGAKVFLPVRDVSAANDVFCEYFIDGEIFELDLLDEPNLRAIYSTVRPAITFNLAGYGVDRDERNERLAYQINMDLIRNVCSAISEVRDDAWDGLDIVNVGTAMEYGLAGGDLAEDSEALPTTLYGQSNLAGTRALTDSCRKFGLKGVTARLFSVYGPGEAPRRLLPTLVHAARTETPIPLTAGLHKRDFVYVEDVAESLLRLGLKSSLPGEVVNVATGVLTSVRTFAETATVTLGIGHERLRFGELPTRVDEMDHQAVTIRRLVNLIGWKPRTMIDEGVCKTVSFAHLEAMEATVVGMGLTG